MDGLWMLVTRWKPSVLGRQVSGVAGAGAFGGELGGVLGQSSISGLSWERGSVEGVCAGDEMARARVNAAARMVRVVRGESMGDRSEAV